MAIRSPPGRPLPAVSPFAKRPLHVPANEQVQFAIIVIVEKAGARTPPGASNSTPFSDIAETSIPVVVIQRIATDAGDQHVFPSVVIIVGNGDSHSVTIPGFSGQPCDFSRICEGPIFVLMK